MSTLYVVLLRLLCSMSAPAATWQLPAICLSLYIGLYKNMWPRSGVGTPSYIQVKAKSLEYVPVVRLSDAYYV